MTSSVQPLRFLGERLGDVSSRACVAVAVIAGCASAPPTEHELAYARSLRPTVELATTPTETAALERAGALPTGEATRLADGVVVAGPVYPAASGRLCRELTFRSSPRLACEDSETGVWVFVPSIFAAAETAGGAETEARVEVQAPDTSAAEEPAEVAP